MLQIEVDGWTHDTATDPDNSVAKKRLNLSLSKKTKERADQENSDSWFTFIDDAKALSLEKKFAVKNTDASTKWALANFLAWRDKHNAAYWDEPSNKVPGDLLLSCDPTVLSKWLTYDVAETQKRDASEYPPKSIYLLLMGLLRHVFSKCICSQLLRHQRSAVCIIPQRSGQRFL